MKVLILSMWYYPEPVTKPHDLAVELVRRGHQVIAITGYPNYPTGQIYAGYRRKLCTRQDVEGVHVLRVGHLIDRSRSALRRVLSYTSFSVNAALGAFKVDSPDVIWTYQIGLPGLLLSMAKKLPWIHEVQDLWPEWGRYTTQGLSYLLFGLLDVQEKMIYNRADRLTTISSGFQRILIEKGIPEHKIEIIPNWANDEHIKPLSRDTRLGDQAGLQGRFNIIYTGNVGTAQCLGTVLEAARLLSDLPQVQFVIIGDGVERKELESRAERLGLKNVRFLGSCPPEQLSSYYAFADVLLLPLGRASAYGVTIPSKTYSYLASGRPILAAASGDVADLVRETGAGVVCPPEDPQMLANTVRELYNLPLVQREAMGTAGREAFLAHFRRSLIVDRYETLFEHVIHHRRQD